MDARLLGLVVLAEAMTLSACGGEVEDTHSPDIRGGTTAAGGQRGTTLGGGSTGGSSTGGSSTGGSSTGGSSAGGSSDGGCFGANRAGCRVNGCPPNLWCDTTRGCVPSTCWCENNTEWVCTDDCGGGTCVPIDSDGGGADCEALGLELLRQMQVTGTCTAVVRVDYQSLKPLAHAFVCAPYRTTNEASARATANADTGYGQGELLSGAWPPDEWVFYTEPMDFGGVSAVNADNGQTVFGGSIVWMGKGDIGYPRTWQVSDIGSGCVGAPIRSARGFDLRSGSELPAAEVTKAAEVVMKSALGWAVNHWGVIMDVVVLLYPRTLGSFDPASAEFIVMVNDEGFE